MNKFIAILALACLASASARELSIGAEQDVESQLSLVPSDDEEISGLEGKNTIFTDFCLSARDDVLSDVRQNSNGYSANLFMTFFNGAENLGNEAIAVQQNAAERLEGQIRDPSRPIGDYDENDESASIIADGQRKIQENPSQPGSLFQGFMSTISATGNLVSKQVVSKLNDLKSGLGIATVTGFLRSTCDRIERYDNQINERFESIKSELVGQDASLAGVTLDKVNCVTTKRVIRLDGLCKFAQGAKEPLMKVLRTRN